jgi:hypothetical protein
MLQSSKHRRAGSVVIEPLESREYFSVDLADSVSFVSPKSLQLKPGATATVAVEVANEGTTKATGNLGIVVGLSASAVDVNAINPLSPHEKINLAVGATKTFNIKLKVPVGFVPGTYVAVAQIDPIDLFSDTNLANNTAISLNSLTVLSPYVNLLGTWSGNLKVTKGVGKGIPIVQVDDFTSENDVTGAFTGIASNYYTNGVLEGVYYFSGFITTKGAFTDTIAADPVDASGIGTSKGKVANNKLTGTYKNALNSGSSALTFVG